MKRWQQTASRNPSLLQSKADACSSLLNPNPTPTSAHPFHSLPSALSTPRSPIDSNLSTPSLSQMPTNPINPTNHIYPQLIHSAALLLASSAAPDNRLAANLFTAGMTMFSGSLYLLVLNPAQFRFLGPVTPLGGLCLIGGWAALAWP